MEHTETKMDYTSRNKYFYELNKKLVNEPRSSSLWDEYWSNKKKEHYVMDYMTKIHIVNFVERWINTGIKTILVAGNGVSQHPKLLQYAGFQVTAIDISPYATLFASAFHLNTYDISMKFFRNLNPQKTGLPYGELTDTDDDPDDSSMYYEEVKTLPKRNGGTLEFITGDFISDDMLVTKPFDLIMCYRTLQYYSGDLLKKACQSLVSRLSFNGFLMISVTNHRHIVQEISDLLQNEDIRIIDDYLNETSTDGKRCQLIFET